VYALGIGIVTGLIFALLRMTRNRWIDAIVALIIDILRSVPALVFLFWFFYCIPILTKWSPSPLTSAAVALGLMTGAFLGEIIRGGILSIERGQWEAAMAIGMTTAQTYRRIVLPQAITRMLPPMASTFISLFKNSALASVVAVAELMWQAHALIQFNFRPIETYTVVAILYFVTTYPQAIIVNYLHRRFQPQGGH
jgi:polar amino acid transport system permease protein